MSIVSLGVAQYRVSHNRSVLGHSGPKYVPHTSSVYFVFLLLLFTCCIAVKEAREPGIMLYTIQELLTGMSCSAPHFTLSLPLFFSDGYFGKYSWGRVRVALKRKRHDAPVG